MAFNFGQSSGGVSGPSGWNNNVINGGSVNFGNGGMHMGNIYTGNIGNNQEAHSTGGTLDQKATADFKFTMPGMEGMPEMGGMGGEKGLPKMPSLGGAHGESMLLLMNLNDIDLSKFIVYQRPTGRD